MLKRKLKDKLARMAELDQVLQLAEGGQVQSHAGQGPESALKDSHEVMIR